MRLIFLGTGGGRFVTMKQLKATAGFLIRSGETLIHVDPGPGAIVHINKAHIDPRKLSAVIVSHNHLDHSNDAAVMVEAMTDGGRKKRGVFIGSKYVVEGGGDYVPALSPYHKNLPEKTIIAEPGQEFYIGNLLIRTTPTWHEEPTTVGFTISDEKVTVSYLSDTGYTEDLEKALKEIEPDVIIFNLISPREDPLPLTNLHTVRSVLSEVRPSLVLLQHFGALITMKRMESQLARTVEREFGVETIALRDGDVIDLPRSRKREEETLERFMG